MASVLITGASGLLGRAIFSAFKSAEVGVVTGTAFSRANAAEGLLYLDLRDDAAVQKLLHELKPRVIVHAAAERRPDACETNVEAAESINVHATYVLARAAASIGSDFLHVSTDYLFDGTAAPYSETAQLSPLNAYGRQKARAESAAFAGHPSPVILRVPVLYGPTRDLTESAVTTFAAAVRAREKPQRIDDWQIRVPTLTTDIAQTLVNMALAKVRGDEKITGIFNYSSNVITTRYKLVLLFGEILGLPTDHITRLEGEPPGARRPYDCKLDTTKLDKTGLAAPHTEFRSALEDIIRRADDKIAP